jgi:hypothetical protein
MDALFDLIYAIRCTAYAIRRWECAKCRDESTGDCAAGCAAIEISPTGQHAGCFEVKRYLHDFESDWPEYGVRMDVEKFWAAADDWRRCLDGKGDKWKPVCAALESAGLGERDPQSVEVQWKRHKRMSGIVG